MTKITMIAVIAVQLVLLIHAVITIQKLDTKIHDVKNLCEQSLNKDLFMPDYGNDQSK